MARNRIVQYADAYPSPACPFEWRRPSILASGIGVRCAATPLAAFPEEAFSKDVVIQRFFGREHILLQRPGAIRHVLIDNAQNYHRSPMATRVLRPMFGRGLFLSAGQDWRQQRRSWRRPLRRGRFTFWRGRLSRRPAI